MLPPTNRTATGHGTSAEPASWPIPLAFHHMPKCGGSSFTQFLLEQYPPGRILHLRGARWNREILLEFNRRPAEERQALLLTIGHGVDDAFPFIGADTLRVTCFREPVERIVSLYHYIEREPAHHLHTATRRKGMCIEGFLESVPTPETRSYFVQRLSKLPIDVIEADPRTAAQAALDGLARDYDLAGLLDRIDLLAAEVARRARFAPGRRELPRVNAAAELSGGVQLSAGARLQIERMNEADILFYRALRQRIGGPVMEGSRCKVV